MFIIILIFVLIMSFHFILEKVKEPSKGFVTFSLTNGPEYHVSQVQPPFQYFLVFFRTVTLYSTIKKLVEHLNVLFFSKFSILYYLL